MVEFRYYQSECIEAIFDYYRSGKRGNIVCAMPTGTGKSLTIGELIRQIIAGSPRARGMMLTHVKKLIEQDAKALRLCWPNAPLGIYSAGMKLRQVGMPVTYGGVKSVASAIAKDVDFGKIDFVIIDEAHLLSDDDSSDYQKVLRHLKERNENMIVIGFSATPYRMKMGMLTDGEIFDEVAYDITDYSNFNRLIAEGYVAPLVGKNGKTSIDTSSVKVVAGEFNQKQLETASGDMKVLRAAIDEVIVHGQHRLCWLGFATGIKNAETIAALIRERGHRADAVHSGLPEAENDKRMDAYQRGEIQCLISGHKLTTGFDHPPIDMIFDLNPTMSTGRHVQKLGRGTRPSPDTGKANCLYLDFSGNVARLGPINDPVLPKSARKGSTCEAPIKFCAKCRAHNYASARACSECGEPFPIQTKLDKHADPNAKPMKFEGADIRRFAVSQMVPVLHEVKNAIGNLVKPPMLKMSYWSKLKRFDEYVLFQHGGFARKNAEKWWAENGGSPPIPRTSAEAKERIDEIKKPSFVEVWLNLKYPKIVKKEYEE